ncbi:L,D-transpeptidase family protein [Paucibacter sp. KCTC 42545]|uniref:L,D-transpeptidase family protein n=1 Tax=Paucibacter sp. KCTC 42545 TaxID=1768242 RepID=UPI0012E38B06|nr:L,D-transpeptidase [Paucibacter sp. KCTC 42545]
MPRTIDVTTEMQPEQSPPSKKPASATGKLWLRGALLVGGATAAAVLGLTGMNMLSSRVEANAPLGLGFGHKAAPAKAEPSILTAQINTQTPEGQLISAFQMLARGEEPQAFATVQALVAKQPDFSLAQLTYADLLLARTTPEAAAQAHLGATPEQISRANALRTEAQLRLAALVERPPQDAVPKELVGLSSSLRHAIVVDTAKARLYLFENSAEHGLRLVKDSYISLGKAGISKQVEGDQRTPLGIYQVGIRRDEAVARYGAAALPLNYPNEYDRLLGRSGSSIWLHGERAGSYARGPQSTDGCIVLSNDDMQYLADTVKARETPVLILEHVDWVAKQGAKPDIAPGFEAAYASWQAARKSQDAATLRSLYEPDLQRGSDSEAKRLEHKLSLMQNHALPLQSLERLSVLPGHDLEPIMIVTYREQSGSDAAPLLKRQYWREQAGKWRIFFDGVVS